MNSLKKLLAIAGLASLTMLTTQSFLKEEFENIFNGKDFKGWYSFVENIFEFLFEEGLSRQHRKTCKSCDCEQSK